MLRIDSPVFFCLCHYLALSSFLCVLISSHFTSGLLHPRQCFPCYSLSTLSTPLSQGIFTCLILKHCSSTYSYGRLTCPFEQISISISSYRVAFLLISPFLRDMYCCVCVYFFLKQHPCLSILLSFFIFLHSLYFSQYFVVFLFYYLFSPY